MNGLEAVRAWRLERSGEKAAERLATAREEASRRRAAAEAEAGSLLDAARQEGEDAADADTARDWTAARRRARGIVLAARRDAYDELVAAATAALTADPRYPDLTRRIEDAARRQLGPGAEVTVDAGSVHATRRARHVEWSAREAVERALKTGALDVEELWR